MIAGNYTFNKMTNINDDSCALTQNNIENSQAETYMLNNSFPSCPMNSAIDFATQQPFVFYNGSHQVGINGCNIAENSELLHTSISRPPLTHPIDLSDSIWLLPSAKLFLTSGRRG